MVFPKKGFYEVRKFILFNCLDSTDDPVCVGGAMNHFFVPAVAIVLVFPHTRDHSSRPSKQAHILAF